MSPIHLIRAEEQIGGKSIELGGDKSFEGNVAGSVKLNESTPGAKDAALVVQGDANIHGTLTLNGVPVAGADKTFVFTQLSALSLWTINHNLGKKPSVSVVTSAGDSVIGDVHYIDDDNLTVSFVAAFGGQAFLN